MSNLPDGYLADEADAYRESDRRRYEESPRGRNDALRLAFLAGAKWAGHRDTERAKSAAAFKYPTPS